MNRKVLTCAVLFLIIFSGCRKNETNNRTPDGENGTDGFHSHGNNCEMQRAFSKAASVENNILTDLVKKTFDSRGRVESISGVFLDIIGMGTFPLCKVRYQPRKMIVLNETETDTVGIYYFDHKGLLVRSLTVSLFFYNNNPFQNTGHAISQDLMWLHRYTYQHSRIKKIEKALLSPNGPAYDTIWRPERGFEYDRKNNISKRYFYSSTLPPTIHFYYYDYSKKIKNQNYPDERLDRLVTFSKHLGLFKELDPINLLVKTYWFDPDYTDINGPRFYKNHRFDAQGRLIFYTKDIVFGGNPSEPWHEQWFIKWNCFNGNNGHHYGHHQD